MTVSRTGSDEETRALVRAATGGDEAASGRLVERRRAELQVHCYRMPGSMEDAEGAVKETFLRTWRRRGSCAGRSTFRAWPYGIATNASLDAVATRRRRMPEGESRASPAEVPSLQPCPDGLLAAPVRLAATATAISSPPRVPAGYDGRQGAAPASDCTPHRYG